MLKLTCCFRPFCPPTRFVRRVLSHAATQREASNKHGELQNKHNFDPYTYTAGFWLKSNKSQREARHIQFDFWALCKKAIQACPGASRVVKQQKKEGAFHRAFLFHMDNDARVVARIPLQFSGPTRLATNSEVATIAYIRNHTAISVPKVLDWSDDPTNPTGTEYIVMECAAGVHLFEKWHLMSYQQQISLIKSAVSIVKEMTKLEFPAYGSLYFADAPISPAFKLKICERFCIGPHCGTRYWCSVPGESRFYDRRKPDRGPWLDLNSFSSALIGTCLSRIPTALFADEASNREVQDHINLLVVSEQVLRELIKTPIIQKTSRPILLHTDFHKRNIFVSDEEPSWITAVIDWHSTSIQPVCSFAEETPDMISNTLFDIPITEVDSARSSKEAPNSDAKKKITTTFETSLKELIPELHNARTFDQTFARLVRCCDTSWEDGVAPLRQELIKLSRRWNEIGPPISCPYRPSPEELSRHKEEAEGFEYYQKLNIVLSRVIGSSLDGWVPHGDWKAAKDLNSLLFKQWLKASVEADGPVLNEEQIKSQWPFDVDIDD